MSELESSARKHEPTSEGASPTPAAAVKASPLQSQYVWGHSDEELKRLEAQGVFLAPMTREFLGTIGLTAGMRVLDVGCGTGDVSFIAAEFVGPTGEIVGIDRAEPALASATARAQARNLTNARFVRGDINQIDDIAAEGPFDAVVGRNVLIHHPNPAEVVRNLIGVVRPSGVVGFQEADLDMPYWSTRPLAAMDQIHTYLRKFVECGMFAGNLGSSFSNAFDDMGVIQRRITRTASAIECGAAQNAFTWIGGFARLLANAAPSVGLPPPEYDPKSIESQLKSEVMGKRASFSPLYWISAAARVSHLRVVED